MDLIEKTFNVDDLIRMEEIELAKGNRPLPSQELIDYWKTTLKSWLDEYCAASNPSPFGFQFSTTKDSVEPLEIRRNSIVEKQSSPAFFAVIAKKKKEGKVRWLCCPISNFSTPATMWEFKIPLQDGRMVVAESWNMFSAFEDEIAKASVVPDEKDEKKWHIKKDSAKIIEHAFERQMECKFQDIPMTSVGPRVFRANDPRIEYQRLESDKFKILSKAGEAERDDGMKRLDVISAKEWLKNNTDKKDNKQ